MKEFPEVVANLKAVNQKFLELVIKRDGDGLDKMFETHPEEMNQN